MLSAFIYNAEAQKVIGKTFSNTNINNLKLQTDLKKALTVRSVYGTDPALKMVRLQKFDALNTQPSITKNLGGVNVRYSLKKNPNYDNPPAKNIQPAGTSEQPGFNCTTSRVSVNANSSSFLSVSADGSGIYPGAIYTFNDFYNGSTIKSVGDGKRNPIVVYANNLTYSSGDIYTTVANPTAATILNAVAPLVRTFSTTAASATSIGQYTYSENDASMALNISAGGSYAGFAASASFSVRKQDKHIYLTCDYKIPLYSLSTQIPPTGFFTDPAIESTPNLMLMSSVLYGTRILANVDIDESLVADSVAAKFSYGKDEAAGAKAAFDYFTSNANKKVTINTYIVGVAPQVSLHPNTIPELLTQVDAVIHSVNYQTARPIAYTLCDMAGNALGVESATDQYTVTNCVPKAAECILQSAVVKISSGSDGKEARMGSAGDVLIDMYNFGGGRAGGVDGNQTTGEYTANNDVDISLGYQGNDDRSYNNFTAGYNGNPNKLRFWFQPNGHIIGFDEWKITKVTLTLNFADKNTGTPLPPKQISWFMSGDDGEKLSHDFPAMELYFDANFKKLSYAVLHR